MQPIPCADFNVRVFWSYQPLKMLNIVTTLVREVELVMVNIR